MGHGEPVADHQGVHGCSPPVAAPQCTRDRALQLCDRRPLGIERERRAEVVMQYSLVHVRSVGDVREGRLKSVVKLRPMDGGAQASLSYR